MTPLTDLLTLDKLRAWAQAKRENEIIGMACSPRSCPLACYLKETDPGHTHHIGCREAFRDDEHHPLPAWATHIVEQVDAHRHLFDPIFAADLLTILDEVTAPTTPQPEQP